MENSFRKVILLCLFCSGLVFLQAQELKQLRFQSSGCLSLQTATDKRGESIDVGNLPLLSWQLNGRFYNTGSTIARKQGDSLVITQAGLEISYRELPCETGLKARIVFRNVSAFDTLHLENVVPLGADSNHVYITGKGDNGLSRSHLFRPGYSAVNVILPDNAWELGFAAAQLNNNKGLCSLMRRTAWDKTNAKRRRFETILMPEGSVTYTMWSDLYNGDWHGALELMFRDRMLYDIEGKFNNSLFERPDLQWIQHAYAMHLLMNWDHQYYDSGAGGFRMEEFLKNAGELYGGNDVVGIWPNWPMLGLDQRNQWDLYRALPGGTAGIKSLAEMCRSFNTKLFISYNPWDESTRNEDHHAGMSEMIEKTTADGVVLDTEGKSSREHQAAADRAKPGVIMYSEGMAVPRDMQGIVAGRVHNALYYPPMLNLNKFIKPDFAIFRVAELHREPIRREYALSFFNGYGTEINLFAPGRPEWIDDDYLFFGRTLMILRANSPNFTSSHYTPLIETPVDDVFVNKWPLEHKTVYTIFSLRAEGYSGPLFEAEQKPGWHYVDLWNHSPVRFDTLSNRLYAAVDIDAFSARWLGTNNEGAVGAIAFLPQLLSVQVNSDTLRLSAKQGTVIKVWKGDPAYSKSCREYGIESRKISLYTDFGRYEGKFVVQLFDGSELKDETSFVIEFGAPRLISRVKPTLYAKSKPEGMVTIPAGEFYQKTTFGDNFIPNPKRDETLKIRLPKFYMDQYPVTNAQFQQFLTSSGYEPTDTSNFLKHWTNGNIPKGQERFPVIWISYNDACAYAAWAGKRLPTETEWQFAAQTPDMHQWPWGDKPEVERKTEEITATLTVSKLQIDSAYCNTGNGILYETGKYTKGVNPYGLYDLVGCVWQLTNDEYDNGTNYFLILKGGSYFLPASSWWYVEGGPRELTYTQKLLRISQGFERCATVGFRCVADAEPEPQAK